MNITRTLEVMGRSMSFKELDLAVLIIRMELDQRKKIVQT